MQPLGIHNHLGPSPWSSSRPTGRTRAALGPANSPKGGPRRRRGCTASSTARPTTGPVSITDGPSPARSGCDPFSPGGSTLPEARGGSGDGGGQSLPAVPPHNPAASGAPLRPPPRHPPWRAPSSPSRVNRGAELARNLEALPPGANAVRRRWRSKPPSSSARSMKSPRRTTARCRRGDHSSDPASSLVAEPPARSDPSSSDEQAPSSSPQRAQKRPPGAPAGADEQRAVLPAPPAPDAAEYEPPPGGIQNRLLRRPSLSSRFS